MKKLALLALFSLCLAGATPVSPASIASPSAAEMQAACDQGYDSYAKSGPNTFGNYVYMLSGNAANGYMLQTSQGSAYSLCRSKAKNLAVKPTISLGNTPLLIALNGTTRGDKLSEVEGWASVLVFKDAAGQEIARITPTDEEEGKSSTWDVKCTSGSCNWRGSNYYFFDLSKTPAADLEKVKQAATIEVLVSAGKGIETFSIDTAQLNKF